MSEKFIIADGVLEKYEGDDARVVIPEGVTAIGDNAFNGCESLESVVIPEGVTEIGPGAFSECAALESVEMPDSLTCLGAEAFAMCLNLTDIRFSTGLTGIGCETFYGCESLDSIVIPEGIQWIGADAFRGCSKLRNVTLPKSIALIGSGAFYGCSEDLAIIGPEDLSPDAGTNGWMDQSHKLAFKPCGRSDSLLDIWNRVDRRDGVEVLEDWQFSLWRRGCDVEVTIGLFSMDGYNLDFRYADRDLQSLADAAFGLDVVDVARATWHGRGPADAYIDPLFEFTWFLSRRGELIYFEAPRFKGRYCMRYEGFCNEIRKHVMPHEPEGRK